MQVAGVSWSLMEMSRDKCGATDGCMGEDTSKKGGALRGAAGKEEIKKGVWELGCSKERG